MKPVYEFSGSLIFFLPFQFIREYTGKVDDLVKEKLEALKEVKAKEQEEKDVIAQQVMLFPVTKKNVWFVCMACWYSRSMSEA